MKLHLVFLLFLLSGLMLQAQHSTDNERVSTLLSGRKNPRDQEIIASLGAGSLDFLLTRLNDEQDQNKVPIYCRLIGLKYRQFSKDLTSEKRTEIITAICSKIRGIKDEGQTAYLIQSSLEHLQGIDHPAVLQLTSDYMKSEVEWTRKAAQTLKESLPSTATHGIDTVPLELSPTPNLLPLGQPPTPQKTDQASRPEPALRAEPTSSTPWSVILILIVAASGLLCLLLKRRS